MTQRTEIIRQEILDQLYGYIDTPRTVQQMVKLANLQAAVQDIVEVEIKREVSLLITLGYVAEDKSDSPTPGIKRYVITAEGVKYLERKGLV